MASNHPRRPDETTPQPGLDMTRGSLQDILDGNDVDVSVALPLVPEEGPHYNANQTLGDIITNRDLGVLSSLKITDADLLICNLQTQLNTAIEKNDSSTALLQRMDNRQKQLEAHLSEQNAEMARLHKERETAIRERRDYTVNQHRLEENIRRNLEKEYADKEKKHLKRLKNKMAAKVKSKTGAVRKQYHTELSLELERLKAEWTQECEKVNKGHNKQISQIIKEVEVLKEQSLLKQKQQQPEPGDKVSGLKISAFNFVPGTVNTKRGGATNTQDETIAWSKYEEPPPVPPRKAVTKQVQFTSTLRHPAQPNLIDLHDKACTTINPFISHLGNPSIQPEAPVINPIIPASTDATTLLGNTMTAVVSELKKNARTKTCQVKGNLSP